MTDISYFDEHLSKVATATANMTESSWLDT